MQKTTIPNFQINVQVSYIHSESRPEEDYYFFAYKISIKNLGSQMAQLMSRQWTITDALGCKEEVRGPGVVGVQPKINAGKMFEYDSACPLRTSSGSMIGRYYFITQDGEQFHVEIPEFYLIAPQALH